MKKFTAMMLGFSLMLGTATAVFANDDKHEGKKEEKKHLTFNDDKHDKKDDHKKH